MSGAAAIGVSVLSPRSRRKPKVPSAILGMLIFVITEIMFFTALVSAFVVIKSSSTSWAPPSSIVLPIWTTLFNSAVLLSSGILLIAAGQFLRRDMRSNKGITLTLMSIAFGLFFVGYQGYEWLNLIRYGMTLKSDIFGSCFYLIIGSHALHAIVAIVAMSSMYIRLANGRLSLDSFRAMQIFWLFVVGMWPILYALVYFPA